MKIVGGKMMRKKTMQNEARKPVGKSLDIFSEGLIAENISSQLTSPSSFRDQWCEAGLVNRKRAINHYHRLLCSASSTFHQHLQQPTFKMYNTHDGIQLPTRVAMTKL